MSSSSNTNYGGYYTFDDVSWVAVKDNQMKRPSSMEVYEADMETPLLPKKPKETGGLSPEEALAHLIKGLTGTGLLSLPVAFKNAGLWTGMGSLLFICFFDTMCMRMLEKSATYFRIVSKRPGLDYANLFRLSLEQGAPELRRFGYAAKLFVNFQIFVAQFGTCCIYFVFLAENSKQVVEYWVGDKEFISMYAWISIWLIPIIPLCLIRHLKSLSLAAMVADVLYLAACLATFQYLLYDLKPSTSLPAFNSFATLPMALGSIMFAFEGVCLVLPIANEVNDRPHFIAWNGVLNTGCILVTVIYACVGFFGYLKFGDGIHDSITLSLPQNGIYPYVRVGFCMAVYVTFALQFYVPLERIEKYITRKIWVQYPDKQNILFYVVRVSLVCMCYGLAMAVPHLNLVISLIGAYSSSSLALLFPALIDMLSYRAKNGHLTKSVVFRDVSIFVLALVAIVTGTYSSLVSIIESFSANATSVS